MHQRDGGIYDEGRFEKSAQTDDDYYDHFHLCFGYGRDLDFRQLAAGKEDIYCWNHHCDRHGNQHHPSSQAAPRDQGRNCQESKAIAQNGLIASGSRIKFELRLALGSQENLPKKAKKEDIMADFIELDGS